MFIKIHRSYRDVVAICDSELIGKKFEEKNLQLEVKESFYQGEKFDKEKIIELMQDFSKEDATFNIVGEKSVECALKARLIDEEFVKHISGIPIALVLG